MGLLKTLDRITGLATKEEPSRLLQQLPRQYGGREAAHPDRYADLPQAYRVHSWVYACVNVIARSIAGVPIKAVKNADRSFGGPASYKERTDCSWEASTREWVKAQEAEVIEDHWLLDTILNPMPTANVTGYEMKQAIITYLETSGNAYVEKIFKNQQKDKISRLWPKIDPRHVWVIPGNDRLIEGYLWRGKGMAKPVILDWDEVMHFTYFHPENPYYGLAPIMCLKQALVGDLRAADWNRMFFENGAVPEAVLYTDQQLNTTQADDLQARWDNRHQGVRRSHKTAVLHSGAEYKSVAKSHKDMDFLDLRSWTKDEVAGVLGVPLFLLGERDKLNRATASAELRSFWENTLIPRLVKIESVFNQSLVPDNENIRLFFDTSTVEALRDDVETKAKIWRLRKDQGVTLNDMRRAWGMPEAEGEGADTIYMPQNMIPVANVAPTKTARSKAVEKDADVETYLPPQDLDTQLQIHREYIPGIYLLGTERGVETLQAMDFEVPADWEQRFNFQQRIERYMDDELLSKCKTIDGTTREQIGKTIKTGMREGKGAKEIASEIRGDFKDMKTWRSQLIARQEGSTAISNGQHELYTATKVPMHGWHCQFMNSRQTHMDAHNRYNDGIPINENFRVGSGSGPGPRMIGIAKEDLNCYCVEIPIIEGKKAYTDLDIRSFEDWATEIENEGAVRSYEDDLAKYFEREGDRYANHWLKIAGGEG